QRCQEQQNTQVRVRANDLVCGLDAPQDGVADAAMPGVSEHRRDRGGTEQEIDIRQVGEIVAAMDIARLARSGFPHAGGLRHQTDSESHRGLERLRGRASPASYDGERVEASQVSASPAIRPSWSAEATKATSTPRSCRRRRSAWPRTPPPVAI